MMIAIPERARARFAAAPHLRGDVAASFHPPYVSKRNEREAHSRRSPAVSRGGLGGPCTRKPQRTRHDDEEIRDLGGVEDFRVHSFARPE